MKAAVIRFPGSNCDQDCLHALRGFGFETEYVWHKETSLDSHDLIVLPGGFSYGDYLRAGAIARFSPVMEAVKREAANGKLILGICNGFQILCEVGLLPGALVRNKSLHFVCDWANIRVESIDTPFTNAAWTGTVLRIPVAHGQGNYVADEATLRSLNLNRQVALRYVDGRGAATPESCRNGSMENIAGICNAQRNVFGMMPHPERAWEERLGSRDGSVIFESVVNALRVAARSVA